MKLLLLLSLNTFAQLCHISNFDLCRTC